MSKQKTASTHLNERFLQACENADIPLARATLAEGANHLGINGSGESALHLAVKSGNCAMVDFAVNELRISVDIRDAFGRTPLHWAAQQGNTPIVEYLLLAQANISAKDDMGVEPKIYADMAGHQELVKIFNIVRNARK